MSEWGISWSDVPGHVSYVLIAISYWMTNVFWLRVIAVVGLIFEIVYFRMSGGAMHTGIGWDIIFIIINLYQIFRLVADERRLRYMKELHLLSQGAFASLNSRAIGTARQSRQLANLRARNRSHARRRTGEGTGFDLRRANGRRKSGPNDHAFARWVIGRRTGTRVRQPRVSNRNCGALNARLYS